MLGVRLFDPDDNRFKLTRRFMAHLVRLRQATVEAAKSLSMTELDELVKKLPDHEVDRIDRRVGLILAARAKLPGAGHLKTEDRNALRALADGAELIAIPSEHRADEIAAELHTDMPWMGPANELAWHAMRRSVREGWKGFRLPPMLLDGPPGIGKSHWARKLGELLTAPVMVLEAGSEGASFGLVGSQRGWSGAEPGRLIRTILRTGVAKPNTDM
ncbi:hypothetical protein [Rhodobacter sp. 24-YEA-8]|uniref:hypothetical protein n=1 Tax=Rhodobacter sp. 24-YEA-8 TaxID=1884310 RepID=UPI000B80EBEA|nr:hypothetical protein [Rhodobacter sp. 24-YEA-8]